MTKEKYQAFCGKEPSIPVFSQPWWLDTVCGADNWGVALVEKGGEIYASMPYFIKKKLGMKRITMPQLTQTMGPYIKYPANQKYYKKLSWEKEMMQALIKQIPNVSYFNQNFSPNILNWLAFYWQGYQQTTRYTYRVENISIDELQVKFETDIRRRRRKKAIAHGLKVKPLEDVKVFYDLNQKTFIRQKLKMPYGYKFIQNLYDSCIKNKSCQMFAVYDQDEVRIAANFLVYDHSTMYYLMGGIDADYKDLGAMDLLLFESIKLGLEKGLVFDFEGSMIESIEKYFRSFGAMQVPYFSITKNNSKLLKTYYYLKDLRAA